MKHLIVFLLGLTVWAQTPPPSSNAATLRGKQPCSATVTDNCITAITGGTVYGGGSGAGDVAGPAASVDSEIAIYSGVGGKTLKRFDGSGILIGTSGVVSTSSSLQWNASTGVGLIKPLTLGQVSNEVGTVKLWGTSNLFTIVPAAATAEWTLTLPANDGDSGQVLQTNGSGVTSWAAAGTGNMTNTGTPTTNALPKYSSTAGTAIAPSGVIVDANNDVTGIRNLTITGTLTAGASGAMELTGIAAPSSPSAGIGAVYFDSTSLNLAVKTSAGVVKHGVITKAAVTNEVVSAIADDGTVTTRALASGDIPNNAANTTGTAASITGNLTGDVTSTGMATTLAAKHKTRTQSITVFDPVTGDSGRVQFMFPYAVTVTSISCSVKAATSATINLDERAFATPDTAGTAVLTTALACDTDGATSTTFSNAGLAADVPIALLITAVSGTPDTVRVFVKYTVD